jgi:hypothetical protein
MPRGPNGERRPADVIGNAVKIMRIATGEEPEDYGRPSIKNEAAASLGKLGGKARAASTTVEQRQEIARKAAKALWRKK